MTRRLIVAIAMALLTYASVAAQGQRITLDQFDQWIFQTTRTETLARKSLESSIDTQILRIGRSITLSEPQRQRIRLAGQGDIKHFFDRVDVARRKFLALGDDLNQNNVNEAYQLASPLGQELTRGIFGDESLLHKVMLAGLNQDQAEAIRQQEIKRRKLKTETALKIWLATLGRSLPMTTAQRQQLLEVGLSEVPPIKEDSRWLSYLIAYHLSRLPSKTWEPILDEAQMKVMNAHFDRARGMEALFRQQGVLSDD